MQESLCSLLVSESPVQSSGNKSPPSFLCLSPCSLGLSSPFYTWATRRGWAFGGTPKAFSRDGRHLTASCSSAESGLMPGSICCLIKNSRTGPVCDSRSDVPWVLILIEFSGLWSWKRSEMWGDFHGPLSAERFCHWGVSQRRGSSASPGAPLPALWGTNAKSH